jgi:hypothetical protein
MGQATGPIFSFRFGVLLRAQADLADFLCQQLGHGLTLSLVLLTLLPQGLQVSVRLAAFLAKGLQLLCELPIQVNPLGGLLLVALDLPVFDDFTQQRRAVACVAAGQGFAVQAVRLGQGVYALLQLVAAARLTGGSHPCLAFAQLAQSQQRLQALGAGHWSNSNSARTVCS